MSLLNITSHTINTHTVSYNHINHEVALDRQSKNLSMAASSSSLELVLLSSTIDSRRARTRCSYNSFFCSSSRTRLHFNICSSISSSCLSAVDSSWSSSWIATDAVTSSWISFWNLFHSSSTGSLNSIWRTYRKNILLSTQSHHWLSLTNLCIHLRVIKEAFWYSITTDSVYLM